MARSEREKLAEELGHIVYSSNNLVKDLADWVEADRCRIVSDLVKAHDDMIKHMSMTIQEYPSEFYRLMEVVDKITIEAGVGL